MADEKTKQQVIEFIKDRQYFRSKRIARELNISTHLVGHFFKEMVNDGLIERWNTKQWTWVET